jgi:hypothetical protein
MTAERHSILKTKKSYFYDMTNMSKNKAEHTMTELRILANLSRVYAFKEAV